jgi:hypothetical protein
VTVIIMSTPTRQQQLQALYQELTDSIAALEWDISHALSEYDRSIAANAVRALKPTAISWSPGKSSLKTADL